MQQYQRSDTGAASPLTPREAEVVRMSWLGLTYAEMARHTGIAAETWHKHHSSAYRRLGVCAAGNRRTAAAVALWQIERPGRRHGIYDPE